MLKRSQRLWVQEGLRSNLNQRAFTLVELMVAIAIVGILATIAIPQYHRIMAKTRQSEAKSILGHIYTGEASYRVEWGVYTTDLNWMGVAAVGRDLRYEAGFGSACVNTPAGYPQSTDTNNFKISTVTGGDVTYWNGYTWPTCGGDCDNSVPRFTAYACGNPGLTYDANGVDHWTIDQSKRMTNPVTGF